MISKTCSACKYRNWHKSMQNPFLISISWFSTERHETWFSRGHVLLVSAEIGMNRFTFCNQFQNFRQKDMKLGLNHLEDVFCLSVKKITWIDANSLFVIYFIVFDDLEDVFCFISKENYMNRCNITFCYLLHSFRQKDMKLGLNDLE